MPSGSSTAAHDRDPIVDFYGGAPDDRGRRLAEIWGWNDERLEAVHDYIQWIFPLDTPSAPNPSAPLVSPMTMRAFRESDDLRQALGTSLERMLAFYGLRRVGGRVEPDKSFPARSGNWLSPSGWRGPNHNHLRITRILRSLVLLGLADAALAFYRCLEGLYEDEPAHVSRTTFDYWTSAISDAP
jgi:Opioid growth factor receptor (OGFr) conserved region